MRLLLDGLYRNKRPEQRLVERKRKTHLRLPVSFLRSAFSRLGNVPGVSLSSQRVEGEALRTRLGTGEHEAGEQETGAQETGAQETGAQETGAQQQGKSLTLTASPEVLQSIPLNAPPRTLAAGCANENCSHRRELSRVQRDLHDQVGSSLAGLTMQLEVVQRLMHSDAERAKRMLAEVHSTTTDLFSTVQRMSVQRHRKRDVRNGHDGAGAGSRMAGPEGCENPSEALKKMTGRMRQAVRDRLDISVDIADGVESALPEVGWAAFWIVNEALTNALRHSHAQHCQVALWTSDGELHVQVEDDGIGGINTSAARGEGSGLGNMMDRASELGGWCTIQPAIQSGVIVLATLPLAGSGHHGGKVAASAGSGDR